MKSYRPYGENTEKIYDYVYISSFNCASISQKLLGQKLTPGADPQICVRGAGPSPSFPSTSFPFPSFLPPSPSPYK